MNANELMGLLGGTTGSAGTLGLGNYGLALGMERGLQGLGTGDLEKLFAGLGKDPKDKGFMDSFFGDKGMLSGLTSAATGLGNLYLGFSALSNAKKQQKFSNRMQTTQLNNATKVYEDGIDQRSQSHAASYGLQGQAKDDFVRTENDKAKLQRV